MTCLPLRPWAITTCLLAATLALAAPTTPEASDSQEAAGEDAIAESSGLRSHAGAAESRAVDLLIEMQPRAAGLTFADKARARPQPGNAGDRPAPPSRPRPSATVTETPPTSKAGLFGSGATPTLQARVASRSDPVAVAADTFASQRRGAASGSGDALPRWLLLPREIIEYVRENRGFVLACVAATLALFWAASSLVSRRRP